MYHFIITTTGLFNTLRTSVFPIINNPKTATFLLGLLYKVNVHTRHISSHKYKEKRDLVHQELKLERKRIRAYVDTIRGEGKWNDDLERKCIDSVLEFIRFGTYQGEPILPEPRNGSYILYPMYKTQQGRYLLDTKERTIEEEAQYTYDHMLRYFISLLYAPDGDFRRVDDFQRLKAPISISAIQTALDDIETSNLPSILDVKALPDSYTAVSWNSIDLEFLFIADAVGAYMVRGMCGYTESEQLNALCDDETLMAICKSPYKCLNSSSLHDFWYPDILPVDNFISVYDESNHSSDILVSYYAHSKTDLFQDNWSAYNGDGIEEYVQDRLTGPMMNNIIKRLSKEKLFIELHPEPEYQKEYLDFLLPYTTERCLEEHKFIAPKEIDIIVKKVYCMLDACRSIIDNSQLYESILPILDALDELIGDMSLSLDSPWKVEYVKKVSRLSQWYRALAYAFTGRSGADDIFKAIIKQQEWNPLVYDIQKDYYMAEWGEPSKAFDLDTVRYALLQYCVSMDYQDVYEQYLQKLCPDITLGEFDYEQQTSILLKQPIHKKDYCYAGRDVALWTKVLWKFYVDEIDPSLWTEIATLWEAWRGAHCFDDLYAYQISVKYMVNLAMHFGDIQRAECYKQTVSDDVSTFMHDMGMPEFGNYPWTAISYYIMADTNQGLGHVEQAMEEFHKAYIIKMHAKSSWEFYEQCNGNAWQIPISRFEYRGTIFGYIGCADMPKLPSIKAYKQALAPYMTYIMD